MFDHKGGIDTYGPNIIKAHQSSPNVDGATKEKCGPAKRGNNLKFGCAGFGPTLGGPI